MIYEIEFPYGDVMEFDNYEDAKNWVIVLLNNFMQRGGSRHSVKVTLNVVRDRHSVTEEVAVRTRATLPPHTTV